MLFCDLQLVSRPSLCWAPYLVSSWALIVPNSMLTLDMLIWVGVMHLFYHYYYPKLTLAQQSLYAFLFYSESLTITPRDARWVGAWWMGFLVSSALLLMSSIPFWFLPRSLAKQEEDADRPSPAGEASEQADDAVVNSHNFKLSEVAKGRRDNPNATCDGA